MSLNESQEGTDTASPPQGRRHLVFLIALIVSLVPYHATLKALWKLTLESGTYSYVPLMPLVVGLFLYTERSAIFSRARWSLRGIPLLAAGATLLLIGSQDITSISPPDRLSLSVLSVLIVWIGLFAITYGLDSLRSAAFPILLLLFMVPVPIAVADLLTVYLARVSAATSFVFLSVLGLPVLLEGNILHFPKISLRIAQECSGFGSFIALFGVGVVVAKIYLRRPWSRITLLISVLPVAILKNVLRIVTLSEIAVHLGEATFDGLFHKLVGFSVFSIVLLAVIVAVLRRLERTFT
jgi:exosortase